MTREDWEVVQIGDIARVISGYAFKAKDFLITGIPVIKIKNIKIGNVEFDNDSSYVEDRFLDIVDEKYIIKNGDILISLTGSHITQPSSVVGRVGKYNLHYPSILNQRAGKFIIKDESIIDKGYLYHVVYNPVFRYQVASFAQGSASQANVSPGQVESIEISLPPLHEQQRIASILSAYDDLIENNTRRIALLEQMAQTLYRQWFVEYKFPGYQDVEMVESETEFGMIPSRWEVKKIGDEIAKIKRAKKIQSKEYQTNGSIPIIDQSRGHIAGYTDDEMYLQTSPLPIVVFGDHTRIVKYISFPFASGADGTQLMYPKNEKMLPNYFYLAILQTEVPNYHYERHYKFLQDKYIIIPSDYILDQFHIQTIPMFDEILSIQKQNQSLKEQRDILLRKLIG